jgi:hypothetical protein
MLLLLEHTFLLLSHPSFTTKVFPVSLRFHRHSAAANPVGEDVSGVLVTPSAQIATKNRIASTSCDMFAQFWLMVFFHVHQFEVRQLLAEYSKI